MSTQAESDFIEQYARTYLQEWCCQTLVHGHIVSVAATAASPSQESVAQNCLEFAVSKGWVSAKSPQRILAKGYATAAAFLKR